MDKNLKIKKSFPLETIFYINEIIFFLKYKFFHGTSPDKNGRTSQKNFATNELNDNNAI
jgi:hypothetical protein